jgi:hypothetical protein
LAIAVGPLASVAVAAILRLNALFLPGHTPLIPISPLHLPAFALTPLGCPILATASCALTRHVAAFAGLAVRPLVALHAFARTINLARGAIRTRRFALHPALGAICAWRFALHTRFSPFGPASRLTTAAVPGVRAWG